MELKKTSDFVIEIVNNDIDVYSTQLAIIENYAHLMKLKPTREFIRKNFIGEFSDAFLDGFNPEQYDTVEDCMVGFRLKSDSVFNYS